MLTIHLVYKDATETVLTKHDVVLDLRFTDLKEVSTVHKLLNILSDEDVSLILNSTRLAEKGKPSCEHIPYSRLLVYDAHKIIAYKEDQIILLKDRTI